MQKCHQHSSFRAVNATKICIGITESNCQLAWLVVIVILQNILSQNRRSRVVAAAIEQNHDDRGITWPQAMAPFQLAIVPLNMQKSEAVASCAEDLYQQLKNVAKKTTIKMLKNHANKMTSEEEKKTVEENIAKCKTFFDRSSMRMLPSVPTRGRSIPQSKRVKPLPRSTTRV